MYQANVKNVTTSEVTTWPGFEDVDRACGNLSVLMRMNGYPASQDEAQALLLTGEHITHAGIEYWVSQEEA